MASFREEDKLKILLATDCHLGYLENDAVRGNDAMVTFEEILKIAVDKEVDFILLGGDLFHENKPSRKILHDCMSLMRKYCMGDRPIQFEFLSDQSENFKYSAYPIVNFEDSNLNVSVPIFSIHGNHDDPAGPGCFCSLDLLSVSGLVNYFGKCMNLDSVNLSPLMLQKGKTKLCLYGLGSIRDERLHRMFLDGKVAMLRPREKCEDWFNLMVLHQNRVKHGAKNYIPEQFLDDFLDLVFWGHEHECRIEKEWNDKQSFFVTQPGSSVATSLCHGEAVPKHVGLLEITGKEFEIKKIPLQTVRQFFIKDVDLEETSLTLNEPDSSEKVMDYCRELVDQFLEKAESEHTGHPKQPTQPLIRLRIFHPHTFETFSVHRFGHSYVSKVANNKDILHFTRKKGERLKDTEIDNEMLKTILKREALDQSRVEDLVKKYFELTDEKKRLAVLSELGVSNAVQEFVDKEVKEAISCLVNHQVDKTQKHLKQHRVESTDIDEEILKFKKERQQNSEKEAEELQSILKQANQSILKRSSNDSDDDDIFADEMEVQAPKTRGRGRGRGSRGGRGGRGSKASVASPASESSSTTSSRRNTSRGAASKKQVEEVSSKRKMPSRNASKQTDLSSFFSNGRNTQDDDDCIIDSDEDVGVKRRKTSKQNGRRGVVFDVSD